MLLSTSVAALRDHGRSWDEIIAICKTAGFDAMDMPFHAPGLHEAETDTEAHRQMLKDLRKKAEDAALVFNQAHAPFPNGKTKFANLQEYHDDVVRTLKYASLLGVKIIVVHPLQHLPYKNIGVPEQLFEMNMEYYGGLQKYCEEYGIRIAVENMFQRASNRCPTASVCSSPEEFCRYMDHLDNRYFTACLDLGHTMLTNDPVSFIHKMGKRIGALHVHDNTGYNDDHMLPFCGILNWDAITAALGSIGYSGDFTYEADRFQRSMPPQLDQLTMNTLAGVGRYLTERTKP